MSSRRWPARLRRLASGSGGSKCCSARSGALALLAECIARLVGDYTLPVTTMVWLSTALTLGAVGAAIVVSGADPEDDRNRGGRPAWVRCIKAAGTLVR